MKINLKNNKMTSIKNNTKKDKVEKSEILFLFESSYNIPNGDPFTGEQRYDEETKKILVSDVRMKRYVRDYLLDNDKNIYVVNDKSFAEGKESGSASRIKSLQNKFETELKSAEAKAKKEKLKFSPALFVMKKCIDVRLFGGIATGIGDAVNLTGAIQFSLLNPSLNKSNLRMHQITTVFSSSAEKGQGSIGTTTLVPYAVNQIHGWVNPKVAENTGMSNDDLKLMFEGLWYGTSGEGSSHSRSKVGQNSLLLLEIVYVVNNKKVYGIDKLIKLTPKGGKKDEEIRSMEDYDFDFTKLFNIAGSDKVSKIRYYSELDCINKKFEINNEKHKDKFEKLSFDSNDKTE